MLNIAEQALCLQTIVLMFGTAMWFTMREFNPETAVNNGTIPMLERIETKLSTVVYLVAACIMCQLFAMCIPMLRQKLTRAVDLEITRMAGLPHQTVPASLEECRKAFNETIRYHGAGVVCITLDNKKTSKYFSIGVVKISTRAFYNNLSRNAYIFGFSRFRTLDSRPTPITPSGDFSIRLSEHEISGVVLFPMEGEDLIFTVVSHSPNFDVLDMLEALSEQFAAFSQKIYAPPPSAPQTIIQQSICACAAKSEKNKQEEEEEEEQAVMVVGGDAVRED